MGVCDSIDLLSVNFEVIEDCSLVLKIVRIQDVSLRMKFMSIWDGSLGWKFSEVVEGFVKEQSDIVKNDEVIMVWMGQI